MIRLTIRCRGAEEEVVFNEEDVITVGRTSKNTLQIPDNMASRKHFLIEKAANVYRVVDLGSKNGTILNGTKVDAHALQKGDRIVTGEATIIVSEISFPGAGKDISAATRPVGVEKKHVGAGGITIRRGSREMPMGLLDYVLVLVILALIVYILGVVGFALKGRGIVEDVKRRAEQL